MPGKHPNILLGHGSGGQLTHELIDELFLKYFDNDVLNMGTDSALLDIAGSSLAFTTDAFVVDPLFFPGGDIGKLSVCGTVNDIAVSGAKPLYLSASFIIEEGLDYTILKNVVKSMAAEAKNAGVRIVTGDTKVVEKGKCDKLFITTSGIGILNKKHRHISSGNTIVPGDKIIINGSIGDHGMSVMSARNELELRADICSDSASLNDLIRHCMDASGHIRFMRDATRGGLATVVSELAKSHNIGVQLEETMIPVTDKVRGLCELLGFDPLYVANEGKVIMVVPENEAMMLLKTMQDHPLGKTSAIIGEIVTEHPGNAWLLTRIGGRRVIDLMAGEQLPRIC
ncbi:MAG: hydrogenase expression/formation protein HypE [Bacteroidales bacterium]